MTEPGPLSSDPFLDSRSSQRESPVSKRRKIGWMVGVLLILSLIASLVIGSCNRALSQANRTACASNLKQLGLAMILYANAHHDAYPDSLEELLSSEDLVPVLFVCPATSDAPPTGPTTQASVAALRTPHHCSYIYLGKGLSAVTASSDTVLAYEPLSNHDGSGMNVLFADGHIDWVPAPGVLPWITAANGGPVTRPAVGP